MTNKEAINELAEMGNALQIIPSTRKGQALKMAILALSAQPCEDRWIPVSERLPSDEDYGVSFTVTIQCEHVDGWDDYVTGYAEWTPHGWDIQSYYLGQIKVTAWMPLSEPYKPESEVSE